MYSNIHESLRKNPGDQVH